MGKQYRAWRLLETYYGEFADDFGGGVSEKAITEVEKILGIKFSDSFQKYLRKYGGGGFQGHFINGLSTKDVQRKGWSLLDNTNFYKNEQKWPGIEDWYIISDDGRGNPIGMNPKGEVWLSDHDASFEQIKLADSFEEFIWRIHNDTLYEDEP
jgi:hypothetical protein